MCNCMVWFTTHKLNSNTNRMWEIMSSLIIMLFSITQYFAHYSNDQIRYKSNVELTKDTLSLPVWASYGQFLWVWPYYRKDVTVVPMSCTHGLLHLTYCSLRCSLKSEPINWILLGAVSISHKTLHHRILWSLKAAGLSIKILKTTFNLKGKSTLMIVKSKNNW